MHRYILRRALGIGPRTEHDLAEMTSYEGDVFIMSNSGLTGFVNEKEIVEQQRPEPDFESASAALVDTASRARG